MTKEPRPAPKPQRRRHFLREWRDYRGLSQEQAAERIGKSRGLISQLESSTTNFTSATLEALAEAYRCEPWDLLNVNPLKEGHVIDIMDLLREATPEQKAEALGYVKGLVARH